MFDNSLLTRAFEFFLGYKDHRIKRYLAEKNLTYVKLFTNKIFCLTLFFYTIFFQSFLRWANKHVALVPLIIAFEYFMSLFHGSSSRILRFFLYNRRHSVLRTHQILVHSFLMAITLRMLELGYWKHNSTRLNWIHLMCLHQLMECAPLPQQYLLLNGDDIGTGSRNRC